MDDHERRRAGFKPLATPPRAADIVHDPRDLVPIPEVHDWETRVAGKYQWCAKCHVVIESDLWSNHLATIHPKREQ